MDKGVAERLTVREAALEEVVVSPGDLLDGLCELQPLRIRQIDQRPDVPLRQHQHLERPDSPPRTHDQEALVLPHHALLLLHLQLRVVRQEVPAGVLGAVLRHLPQLRRGLLGQRGHGPDLAVRVRVRAAHGGALVLEDLHVAQLRGRARDGRVRGRGGGQAGQAGERVRGREVLGVDAGPGLDDGDDLGRGHVGERQVVLGGEGEDVTDARGGLGLQERRREILRSC